MNPLDDQLLWKTFSSLSLCRFLILLYLDLKDLKYYTHFSIDLREQKNMWNSKRYVNISKAQNRLEVLMHFLRQTILIIHNIHNNKEISFPAFIFSEGLDQVSLLKSVFCMRYDSLKCHRKIKTLWILILFFPSFCVIFMSVWEQWMKIILIGNLLSRFPGRQQLMMNAVLSWFADNRAHSIYTEQYQSHNTRD